MRNLRRYCGYRRYKLLWLARYLRYLASIALIVAGIGGANGQTLVTASVTGISTSMNPGGAQQLTVTCHYSDSSSTNCTTTDTHGDMVTAWSTSNGSIMTITSSGIAQGVAVGTATATATVTGGIVTSPAYSISVVAPTLSLTGLALTATGGVTSFTAGTTLQLIATCTYSDESTTNCGTTDIHGNVVAWSSSAASMATVNASGLAAGVAAGGTVFTATTP